jgi:RNA polymerase sigma factor (sigma-70 family)
MLSPEQAAHAKHRLIEGHLWLAVSLVKRSGARLCTLSPLDLVQEGNLGLLRALDRFDVASSGGNFTAYASTTIRYAILDALPMEDTIQVSHDLFWRNRTDERVEALRALQPLSLDAAHGEEDCAFRDVLAAPPLVLPELAAEEEQHLAKRVRVEALLARLTPREQQVLRLRYGLDEADGCAHTPTAIARKLGLDCSTVCTLEKQALQKLRALQDAEAEEACHPQIHRPSTPSCPPQEQAQRRQEQFQQLEAACTALEGQGASISVRSLACLTHIDKAVIGPFLRVYWERQGSEQERLTRACAALEAEGVPVTMAGLCSRAHVGSKPAAAFLKNYHPVARPKKKRPVVVKQATHAAKETPPERLRQAFACLLAQGEQITRARLRQEAGVSTDAAGAFLRAQRVGDAHADLPSIERGNRQP